jgi:hypothetical protein
MMDMKDDCAFLERTVPNNTTRSRSSRKAGLVGPLLSRGDVPLIRPKAALWKLVKIQSFVFLFLPVLLFAQIRIKPRVYIGVGIGHTLDAKRPSFSIDDWQDQYYADNNIASLQRNFTRGQIRIDLIQVGDFALGYTFWANYLQYPYELIDVWQKDGKAYPYSNYAGLHAVTVQWDMKFLSGKWVVPFLLGGAGQYYGNFDMVRFQWLDVYKFQYIGYIEQQSANSGRAFLGGVGAMFFKYTYAYVGFVHLVNHSLPSKGFLDVIVGFTI